ncbi:MAG TPA: hypothetical protein VFR94_12175 [Nitrososphaeraceae archaeon]|nr:hypothetical protein [Nitrososphaeraceae archaeon]
MHGYEILYFGVNLILMFDYRLPFNIEVIKNSDGNNSDKIEVLIINRKDVPAWKKGNNNGNNNNNDIKLHYSNSGERINDIFKPSASNAYAFILSNRTPHVNNSSKTKAVDSWRGSDKRAN